MELEEILNYKFNNKELLENAMLHRSAANEMGLKRIDSNERLEFLGDAVLELVSSNYLLEKYPDKPEGELTKLRAGMVCEVALCNCAIEMGLHNFIMLGKGEEANGGRKRPSITSDALEATIGAIYLDGGYEPAKTFIHKYILDVQSEEGILFKDSKTALQEKVQEHGNARIEYKLISSTGPDHDKTYEIAAIIDGVEYEHGTGHTKKAAEQQAAYKTLKKLNSNQ